MKTQKQKSLKRAYDVFYFWFTVLLELDDMNDPEFRKEYLQALETLNSLKDEVKAS
ncbi:hypothetical protein SAMN05216480_10551 [Pustulibacterium marinum]|uniref:Uncharacterized protein n=1 Tax=Pustulibacterium marinum TaxID=1224947 RepID=A0A1I7GL81_9FLAO|nr:hypothetical protein [Pustulibacterium marinum]SFU49188.1 hypothetical protein SAMN05216480_10551 [Pustulibacterium marinum]